MPGGLNVWRLPAMPSWHFSQKKTCCGCEPAAQAGCAIPSRTQPLTYEHLWLRAILDARRHCVEHLVYASSSSVYGGNSRMPFSSTAALTIRKPVCSQQEGHELMAHTYSHLYDRRPLDCAFSLCMGLGTSGYGSLLFAVDLWRRYQGVQPQDAGFHRHDDIVRGGAVLHKPASSLILIRCSRFRYGGRTASASISVTPTHRAVALHRCCGRSPR